MNWLAHLYLSEPNAPFQIGNLLPDFLPAARLHDVAPSMQEGIARHRAIDAFTDRHPVVRRSVARFPSPHRRFGGVLVDIFFDHFLAKEWSSFSPVPLETFVSEFHAAVDLHREQIPADAYAQFQHLGFSTLLCSYRNLSGIEAALARLGRRFRRPANLAGAVPIFVEHEDAFRADFEEFFPELCAFCGIAPDRHALAA